MVAAGRAEPAGPARKSCPTCLSPDLEGFCISEGVRLKVYVGKSQKSRAKGLKAAR